MKISELITHLQSLQAEHGDVPVYLHMNWDDGYDHLADRLRFKPGNKGGTYVEARPDRITLYPQLEDED